MNSVVIIGGGLGGLFTGAILAKEGLKVYVVEKNATIGGGLQTFRRFGEEFDTGMHIVGGFQKGGSVRRICQYLGIADDIRLKDVDEDCSDRLYFAEDQQYYTIAKGREGFIESLARSFPLERDNLRRYVDAMYAMAGKVDLYNLRESQGSSNLFSGDNDFLMPTSEFIAKYVSDERLRSVLAYMNPLHGGMAGNTPAYVHTLISILYINGESRFIDGSSHLADLLAGVITDHGGEISTAEAAEWLQVTDRHVDYLRTSKGRQLTADWYVSDIHPCTLLKLMDAHAFPKSYRDRLDSIPNAHSAFSLYLKMKENSFPYINHTEYFMTRYADIWNFSRSDKPWPLGLMMMTPPVTGQGPWSQKVLVTAPMPFNMAARWEHTQTGRRGADYEQWKREKADALLALIEEMHPGFRECIEQMETSSPLTIRDYYAVKDGSISGFAKDCRNIALSQVPVVTKIHNLLLTGQNCNLHGICGVPLTAITTCEAILGLNHIIRRINACTEP